MQRFLALTIAVSAAVGTLSAGTIQTQIGGVNGLTGSYVGAADYGVWREKNYDFYLFNGVMTAGPGTNYNATFNGAVPTNSLTDNTNGVTFALVDDGCGGTPAQACNVDGATKTNNVWVAGQSGPSSITIPIGIFDVTEVWTMLQNEFGPGGAQDTTVQFDFGTTATTANLAPLILDLVNSASNSAAIGGQIRTGTTSTNSTCATCGGLSNGPLSMSSTVDGMTVLTSRIFSQQYNTLLGNATAPFVGSTAGTVFLNDQGFQFGNTYQGVYLVDVKITDNNGGAGVSQTALSAITVDSTAPEPSSLWLALAGAVGLGVIGFRRRVLSA